MVALIKPIGSDREKLVTQATMDYIVLAGILFQADFPLIPIEFNLTGRTAGMYRVRHGVRVIRYNPYLFARYFSDNLATTVPHEVAHYITDLVYGLRKIRPHGIQWKELMGKFGADASRTCDYDMDGIPRRVYQRFPYKCECTNHELTARRRNQIRKGNKRYICRKCGSFLVPQAE